MAEEAGAWASTVADLADGEGLAAKGQALKARIEELKNRCSKRGLRGIVEWRGGDYDSWRESESPGKVNRGIDGTRFVGSVEEWENVPTSVVVPNHSWWLRWSLYAPPSPPA